MPFSIFKARRLECRIMQYFQKFIAAVLFPRSQELLLGRRIPPFGGLDPERESLLPISLHAAAPHVELSQAVEPQRAAQVGRNLELVAGFTEVISTPQCPRELRVKPCDTRIPLKAGEGLSEEAIRSSLTAPMSIRCAFTLKLDFRRHIIWGVNTYTCRWTVCRSLVLNRERLINAAGSASGMGQKRQIANAIFLHLRGFNNAML